MSFVAPTCAIFPTLWTSLHLSQGYDFSSSRIGQEHTFNNDKLRLQQEGSRGGRGKLYEEEKEIKKFLNRTFIVFETKMGGQDCFHLNN